MLRKLLFFFFGFLIITTCNDLFSQENNKIIYEKSYFQKFNITNANEAIKRIPGVEGLTQGNARAGFDPNQNDNKRGFGSSGTQILINGERQSSKANNIVKTLERIQINSIERIEVIRGSVAGLDVRSDGIIVNLIVDYSSSQGTGTWQSSLRILTSGDSLWSGGASWSKKIGKTDLVLGFEKTGFMNSRLYHEDHIDKNENIIQYRIRETIEYKSKNRINIDLNSKITPKDTLRLNMLTWFDSKEAEPQSQYYYGSGDSSKEDILRYINWNRTDDQDGWEIGGDWEHTFNSKHSFKFRSVLTKKNNDKKSISKENNGDYLNKNFYISSKESNDRSENERILRASFNTNFKNGGALEYGVESAYNKLERSFALLYLNPDGISQDSGLFNTKGKVEEDRYEGFVSYNFPLTNLIRSEIAMNYEWSEISQSGDVELSREFQYWKPRIDFKWDYRKNRQVRFSILRNVGQINFDDFISSFDQFEERIRAGNPDLKPSTAWEINLEHEWRLANDGGVITLTGFASQIDGPVERVPVGGYAAVGNLGTGEITQAKLDGSIRIGNVLPGGVLRFMGYLQSTEVLDPVTNIKRDLHFFRRWETMLDLRQDIPNSRYSWRVWYRSYSQTNIYDPYLWGRWAEEPMLGGSLSVKINSKLNLNFMFNRLLEKYGVGRKIVYNGFKSSNDILIQENFYVRNHGFIKIQLEGTF